MSNFRRHGTSFHPYFNPAKSRPKPPPPAAITTTQEEKKFKNAFVHRWLEDVKEQEQEAMDQTQT